MQLFLSYTISVSNDFVCLVITGCDYEGKMLCRRCNDRIQRHCYLLVAIILKLLAGVAIEAFTVRNELIVTNVDVWFRHSTPFTGSG